MIYQTTTPPREPTWCYVRVYLDAYYAEMFGRYRATSCADDVQAKSVAAELNAFNRSVGYYNATYIAMPYSDACELIASETVRGQ